MAYSKWPTEIGTELRCIALFCNRDGVPRPYKSFNKHSGIEPTPSWILFLGDAFVVSVLEPPGIQVTGNRITHDLDLDVCANPKLVPRFQFLPVKPGERQVLSGGASLDRMALVLQPLDQLLRVQAKSPIRPAVEFEIPLPVTRDTGCGMRASSTGRFGTPPSDTLIWCTCG